MPSPTVRPVTDLTGREVVRWTGTEMALSGGEPVPAGPADTAPGGPETQTPIVWEHETVPYLQFTGLDLHLADGAVLSLLSQFEDGTGYHGLYLLERGGVAETGPPDPGSIYRDREVAELPVGVVRASVIRRDGPNAVLEAAVAVGDDVIRVVAGEVCEAVGDGFRVCEPDESLLVQLNGARPRSRPLTVFQRSWREAAGRLGLRVEIPYRFRAEGHEVEAPVLLRDFGAARGMLLVTDVGRIAGHTDRIVGSGYGFACLDGGPAGDGLEGLLLDWGWTGAGPPPRWLDGGAGPADAADRPMP